MTTVNFSSLVALIERNNKRNRAQAQMPCPLQQSVSASGFDSNQFRSALVMLAASSLPSPTEASSSASISPSSSVTDAGQSYGDPTAMRQRRPLDRSASDPVPSSSSISGVLEQQQQQGIGGGRYKTELCRPFEENGSCKYADKCQFAHGRAELRPIVRHPKYKTDLCRTYHTTGLCPYGPRCHFIHNDEERRLYEMNRLMLEHKQQQQQLQQASLARTASTQHHQQQQQQDSLAAALLAHRRLATSQSSAQQQQQQIECVMASSLQRSLSLGSQRTSFGSDDVVDANCRAGSAFGNMSSAMQFSNGGRGSVDSMSSVDSTLSPTSSNKIMSSSSSSDVEYSSMSSNQLISGDQHHHGVQRQPRNTSPLVLSPEHFSYPVVNNVVTATSQLRQSSPRQQPLPSSDTAIMLALLTRRVRDAELLRAQQQTARDDEVKAMLTKLIQSATVAASTSSMRYDVSSTVESSGVGRCSGFGMATEQPAIFLRSGR